MKTVLKKTIKLETKKHDFDNEFAYIEVWSGTKMKDCYFAEKEFLYPDGTIRSGGRKYFYSLASTAVEKRIKQVNDERGEIINIKEI
jgi:hypothetical protein